MENEPIAPAKEKATDARDAAPPDTRQKVWRVIMLGFVVASLWIALWALGLGIVKVMKEPPPMPVTPLKQAFDDLKYGMTIEEAVAVMAEYDPWRQMEKKYNVSDFGAHWFLGEPEVTGGECYNFDGTSAGLFHEVKWRWWGKEDGDGKWAAILWLQFYDGKLGSFWYSYHYEDHRECLLSPQKNATNTK